MRVKSFAIKFVNRNDSKDALGQEESIRLLEVFDTSELFLRGIA